MSKAPAKPTRGEQWTANSFNRRKAIVAAGGRQLILVIDKLYADQLNSVIDMRHRSDPKMTVTEWFRRMIVSDLKDQIRRRSKSGKAKPASDR